MQLLEDRPIDFHILICVQKEVQRVFAIMFMEEPLFEGEAEENERRLNTGVSMVEELTAFGASLEILSL